MQGVLDAIRDILKDMGVSRCGPGLTALAQVSEPP